MSAVSMCVSISIFFYMWVCVLQAGRFTLNDSLNVWILVHDTAQKLKHLYLSESRENNLLLVMYMVILLVGIG